MTKVPKEPDDLGVKVGSKREAFLTKVQKMMQEEVESSKMTIDFNNLVLPVIAKEIEKEKEKFK